MLGYDGGADPAWTKILAIGEKASGGSYPGIIAFTPEMLHTRREQPRKLWMAGGIQAPRVLPADGRAWCGKHMLAKGKP